ncbi:MAG: hypothetical protein WC749_02855 [Dehalococcoidia bacterium]
MFDAAQTKGQSDRSKGPDPYMLNEEMLKQISEQFSVEKGIKGLDEENKKRRMVVGGREFFTHFGESLAKMTAELGEKYDDKTYEAIRKDLLEPLGQQYRFPIVLQRFVEIAYLSLFPSLSFVDIREGSLKRLAFRINNCPMYGKIKEVFPQAAADLICQYGCVALGKTLCQQLRFDDVKYGVVKLVTKAGYCEFEACREEKKNV